MSSRRRYEDSSRISRAPASSSSSSREQDPQTRKRNVALRGVFDGFDVERSGNLPLEQLRGFGSEFDSLVTKMEDDGEDSCDATYFLTFFNKLLGREDDDDFTDAVDRMHGTSDRVRTEFRNARKMKRNGEIKEVFMAIDSSSAGSVPVEDLYTLAESRTATGRDASSVWTTEKIRSVVRNIEGECSGDMVDQAIFVETFERMLPSDTEMFDANVSMLKKSAGKLQGAKKRNFEAKLEHMDPIERNTHACQQRTNEAQQDVRMTIEQAEQAARELEQAVAECKAAAVTEARMYAIAADKTQRREVKEVEEEEAQENLSEAQREQAEAEKNTRIAKKYDEEKEIEEEEAVERTDEARVAKKEADEELRIAVVKRVDAVEKRDECQSEVERLRELLRLALLALERAEEVARLAREWEDQKEREAEAAKKLLEQREDEQEVAEREHRRATADLALKREIEAEKVRTTKRRHVELEEAIRLLQQAVEVEIEAIASAEQSTRFLYAKQYEVCCADVVDADAQMKAWRAADLKDVRVKEQTSGDAWWVAEQKRMQAEEAHLRAAAAEEEHRMWELRRNFEFGNSYAGSQDREHQKGEAKRQNWSKAGHAPNPSSPREAQDTEEVKDQMHMRAKELRSLADELKERYHELLDVAKAAHEEARRAGKNHDAEATERAKKQDGKVRDLGENIKSGPPCRWREVYVNPLRSPRYPELPPMAGTMDYILSDKWMTGLDSGRNNAAVFADSEDEDSDGSKDF